MDLHFHVVIPDGRPEPITYPSEDLLKDLLESLMKVDRLRIQPANPEHWQLINENTGEPLDPKKSLQQNGVTAGCLLRMVPRKPVEVPPHTTPGPVAKTTFELKRCENGHYYDPKKHTKCPYCGVPDIDFGRGGAKAGAASSGDAKTQPAGYPAPPRTSPAGGDEITVRVGLTHDAGGIDPVVGWLVAVGGPDKGRDYRIRSENNAIGRSKEMEIYIASDGAISRERHAVVTFDPQHNAFYLSPGGVQGLVYLNGEVVFGPQKLTPYDKILMGKTTLLFVPFCGEKFKWE
jgi:FHA domain